MSTIKYLVTNFVIATLLLTSVVICPPARAGGFAQQATYGGSSTGTANAQIVSIGNVGSMNDLLGVTISFKPGSGLTNTGATTIAINNGVSTLTPVTVEKASGGSLVALSGGEMPAGLIVQAMYDGTEFVLQSNYTAGVPSGQVAYYDLSSCPPGWSAANGSGSTVNVVGQFIRSLNTSGSGFDPDRTLASTQADSIRQPGLSITAHVPEMTVGGVGFSFWAANGGPNGFANTNGGSSAYTTPQTNIVIDSESITGTGPGGVGNGVETRPQNVALLACQKN